MEKRANVIGWIAGREWRVGKESDEDVKLTEWEVKQIATQIYVVYQSNPRKVEENEALAAKAIQAAIDFQMAWNHYGKLKTESAVT